MLAAVTNSEESSGANSKEGWQDTGVVTNSSDGSGTQKSTVGSLNSQGVGFSGGGFRVGVGGLGGGAGAAAAGVRRELVMVRT